ncbi:hypothetical protein CL631_03080 [bacterium]|jgi:hypothetical protein|nr:hypothetical protein [bacterium]|tara:strand:+ start:5265 stop:5462 length:198 start_codon:yes stop_codon:yes gene_type:complete
MEIPERFRLVYCACGYMAVEFAAHRRAGEECPLCREHNLQSAIVRPKSLEEEMSPEVRPKLQVVK